MQTHPGETLTAPERWQGSLRAVAERYGIRRLWLAGSYAQGRATAASDVDVVVEWPRSVVPTVDLEFAVEDALTAELKRPVTVISSGRLEGLVGQHIRATRQLVYSAAG